MEATCKQFRKRNAILECLRNSHEHPGAETIYAQLKESFPDISLATVYRNLALFKRQGLIASLGTVDGVERFDGVVKPHVHFICTKCDSVVDMPGIVPPESLCSAAASKIGGQVDACQLTFTGICKNCLTHKSV